MNATKRLTATVAALGAAALMGLAFAGPAGAVAAPGPYPTGTPTGSPTLGPPTGSASNPAPGSAVAPGEAITLAGGGATPGGDVSGGITAGGTSAHGFVAFRLARSQGPGASRADSAGNYSVSFTIPSDQPSGPATLFTTDATTGKTLLSIPVKVVNNQSGGGTGGGASGGSTGGGGVAYTGVAIVGIGILGVLLVGGGAVLLFAGRRRKVLI